MRVALLQIRLNAESRAWNMQAIMTGIRNAAQAESAPDLMVLPGACDTGGILCDGRYSDACLDGVRETIAGQAREWGVFIAAGLHQSAGEVRTPGMVLFDPDGDVVAEDPAPSLDGGQQLETWLCPVGRLGVMEPGALSTERGRAGSPQSGALYAVSIGAASDSGDILTTGVDPGALCENTSNGKGAFWAVVLAASDNAVAQKAGRLTNSFICDPSGSLLAHADTADETIVHAEVPLLRGVEEWDD